MTRKAMKKLAKEIYDCELIHQNLNSSIEEKTRAESQIMRLTRQTMALKNGYEIMLEVDELVQELLGSKQ